MSRANDPTSRITALPPSSLPTGTRGMSLVVMSAAGVFTYPITRDGPILIGRGAEADVPIADGKASRRHVVLQVGEHLDVVDLGSTNGTLVRDTPAPPNVAVPLRLGDTFTIGSTVLVVKESASNAVPTRVFSVEELDAQLAELKQRDEPGGRAFGLIVVRTDPDRVINPLDSTSGKVKMKSEVERAERLSASLQECVRPTDVIASLSAGRYELLLVDATPDLAETIAERLRERLAAAGFPSRVGVACAPRDGVDRATLEAVAEAALVTPTSPPPAMQLDAGAMGRLAPLVARVATGNISVLILGETGVGKEVMARSLHERSPRAAAALVTINCAALSESLLESELFGHERGAFTGATQAKEGLLEAAQGGTVFLDEVGEMPLTLQAKLLRVLEQREVLRVGATKPRPIDVRFIAATNRDLEAEVQEKRFRGDLYFRLCGVTLTIPPLRERREEILPLAKAFIAQVCLASHRRSVPAISPEVLALLHGYSWPGNIRELRNIMERAVLMCQGSVITLDHLPAEKMGTVVPIRSAFEGVEPAPLTFAGGGRMVISGSDATGEHRALSAGTRFDQDDARIERALEERRQREEDELRRIQRALEACRGNQTQAAKLLGISRRTLITRLDAYALPRPRKRTD